MNMKEEELRQLLDTHGWYLVKREREGTRRNATYLIAQKKGTPKNSQVYITTRRQLPIVSQEEVLLKIGVAS